MQKCESPFPLQQTSQANAQVKVVRFEPTKPNEGSMMYYKIEQNPFCLPSISLKSQMHRNPNFPVRPHNKQVKCIKYYASTAQFQIK